MSDIIPMKDGEPDWEQLRNGFANIKGMRELYKAGRINMRIECLNSCTTEEDFDAIREIKP
jgi:hypothetical protein